MRACRETQPSLREAAPQQLDARVQSALDAFSGIVQARHLRYLDHQGVQSLQPNELIQVAD